VDGRFPIHYLPHRIANYNVIIKYGYIARQVTTAAIEQAMTKLLQTFKARTKYEDLISTEDFTDALSVYQHPAVKLLSVTFTYNGTNVDYMLFDKTQIARLNTISYQQVSL
jgi:hypothetical protein